MKKNKIDEQRDILLKRIREYVITTEDDQKELNNLLKR